MVGTAALIRGTRRLVAATAAFVVPAALAQGLLADGACREGEPNGAYTLRAPDGRLRVAGAFAKGQRTGTFLFWSERRDRVAVVPYDNGRKAGTIAVWHAAAAPGADAPRKSEAAYAGGVLHGEKRSWYPHGKLRTWLRYERGELVEARAWTATGAPLSEGEARARAARDAATDEAFYATLEALVAGHLPKCEAPA